MGPFPDSAGGAPKTADVMRCCRTIACVLWLCMGLSMFADSPQRPRVAQSSPPDETYAYLARRMDQYHRTFYIYSDFLSGGNHFYERGLVGGKNAGNIIPPMDENCRESPASGLTCIKCSFTGTNPDWGGWCFLSGAFDPKATASRQNWGNVASAGYDLRGATQLTFMARGRRGGERVEFYCLGAGRASFTGRKQQPFPDSSPKLSLGCVALSNTWQRYAISLEGADLSRTLLGFGWTTTAARNQDQEVVFYLDDIQFNLPRPRDPHFVLSYETTGTTNMFDLVMRNVAFVYDNALALLAFLSANDLPRARLIADSMVYAQTHDRYFDDGRLRNAYQAGDLTLPPGWKPNGKAGTVRIPGWYDPAQGKWLEDSMQVGTHAGNMAWAILALLAFHEKAGGGQYLAAAERLGEWVDQHCRDARGAGGYTGGYEGWEPHQTRLLYKSTEHNIDLYVAFERLYLITRREIWHDRALHARGFALAMWDDRDGKFWTGTTDDGLTVFTDVIPLDCQTWSILALQHVDRSVLRALDFVESRLKVRHGFDFNEDRDGVWFEGTAQMASALYQAGQREKADELVRWLQLARMPSGGIAATDRDRVTTGFQLSDGNPWLYFRRPHIGATSWLMLAERRVNPFWLGCRQYEAARP